MFSIFRKLSFADVFSLLNLASGILGIITGMLSFVFLSAIFDGLDGMTARLRGNSEIGEELDSLSDLVSFGVLPAFFLAKKLNPILVSVAIIYVLCSALRLARFNVVKSRGFIGLPITASALMLACLMKVGLCSEMLLALVAFFLSIFMICDVEFPKIRDFRLLAVGGIATFTSIFSRYGALLLLTFCVIYIITPVGGVLLERSE